MNIIVENNLGVDLQNVLMVLVATLIIIFIAKKYFWKVVLQYIAERQQYINSQYDDALKSKQTAEALKLNYEEKLQSARLEASSIIESGKKQAQQIYQEKMDQSRQESENLLQRTYEAIELEKKHASESMHQQIKEIALLATEKILKEKVDSNTHDQYVDEFLSNINE